MATHVPAFDNYVSARFELAGAYLALTSFLQSEELAEMAMELAAGGDDPDDDAELFKEIRQTLPPDIPPTIVRPLDRAITHFHEAIRVFRDWQRKQVEGVVSDELSGEERAAFTEAASALIGSQERMEMTRKLVAQAVAANGQPAYMYADDSPNIKNVGDRMTHVLAAISRNHPWTPAFRFRGQLFLPKLTNGAVTGFQVVREDSIADVET